MWNALVILVIADTDARLLNKAMCTVNEHFGATKVVKRDLENLSD